MNKTPEVVGHALGIAAFAVDGAAAHVVDVETAPRVRSASVAKPLLAWAAAGLHPFANDSVAWASLARLSITVSDNEATAALWSAAGGDRLLAALNRRVGLAWHTDGDGEHPSLRLMVTAGELAHAYVALASDGSDVASDVCQLMRVVPDVQTFGVRRVAYETLGAHDGLVGVKCGWFGGERAHAAVLAELPNRCIGAVVTTSRSTDRATEAAMRDASGDDTKLIAAHEVLVGDALRAATRRALLVAAGL